MITVYHQAWRSTCVPLSILYIEDGACRGSVSAGHTAPLRACLGVDFDRVLRFTKLFVFAICIYVSCSFYFVVPEHFVDVFVVVTISIIWVDVIFKIENHRLVSNRNCRFVKQYFKALSQVRMSDNTV